MKSGGPSATRPARSSGRSIPGLSGSRRRRTCAAAICCGLQRVADLILNEAHASWERLQRALAFMQPNGSSVYRRFMDSGVLPLQTPALGLAGGLDVPGYLGDGGQGCQLPGLHFDDSHNGTTVSRVCWW